jgi:uncharacterized protein (DUF736 family)
MFPTGQMKLLRAGEVHFDATPERLAIVQVQTKNDKTVFEVYQKIGAVFPNIDQQNEKSPDVSGKITYNHAEWKMAGWKQESKSGLEYTSISLSPPIEAEINEPTNELPPLDDDIPF